jgi:uncharacterized cupin superfamily protein
MGKRSALLAAVALVLAMATPASAQVDTSWRNKWFWGAQGGATIYDAPTGTELAVSAGGHWLITAGTSALYFAFDETFYSVRGNGSALLADGRSVTFDNGQRIQVSILAVPGGDRFNILLGAGFVIQRVTDPVAGGTFASLQEQLNVQEQIDQLATKAFLALTGGFQLRFLPRWAIFGQYQFTPSVDDFLISSPQHTFDVGLRFIVTHSKEAVSTER